MSNSQPRMPLHDYTTNALIINVSMSVCGKGIGGKCFVLHNSFKFVSHYNYWLQFQTVQSANTWGRYKYQLCDEGKLVYTLNEVASKVLDLFENGMLVHLPSLNIAIMVKWVV